MILPLGGRNRVKVNFKKEASDGQKIDLCKVSEFQNEFIKSSFLPKYEQKLSRFLPSLLKAETPTIFCSNFGRNDEFINSV